MIPYDKKLHLAAGLIISIIGGLWSPMVGLMLSMVAGVGKEVYDYFDYGLFDWKDMLATWAGGVMGYLAMAVIQ